MVFDLIIIGAGAAGCTASIYASRYGLKQLIFGEVVGGQFLETHEIQNYPGFTSILGAELAEKFRRHVEFYGVKIREEGVAGVAAADNSGTFRVTTRSGEKFKARSLVLAMGARARRLNIPGEEKFLGRGVSYCGLCDAPLFRGKTTAVVGGGDSAVETAVHLASFARKVYLIHRRAEFRAEAVWLEKLRKLSNVEKVAERNVVKVLGEAEAAAFFGVGSDPKRGVVAAVELDKPYAGSKALAVAGLFVEIGSVPAASLANRLGVKLDESGSVIIGADGATNIPGVFAAGDIANIPGSPNLRQIVTAAAEGAVAAAGVYQFLHGKEVRVSWGRVIPIKSGLSNELKLVIPRG